MKASELILNADGSIYHLALRPEDISDTIILVGDPDRAQLVSRHFDSIEIQKQKREFITHTGWLGGKKISVISTGIGTDNIDIVLNELDALVNIDFNARKINTQLTSLNIIRIGTSGSIHPNVLNDDILISGMAIGTDTLGAYYQATQVAHLHLPSWSYITERHPFDLSGFNNSYTEGITLTCPGFYGPQGRSLRLSPGIEIEFEKLYALEKEGMHITNMEMETAGIYLLASKLGHHAISLNAILAERLSGRFSAQPEKTIKHLISTTLDWINVSAVFK
ncbi:MAG: nucleoside phosphorylase [Bacteroidota bacterium]|nr:nucleoside phosphorylase [Bacteroidota bacterium]